MAGYKHPCRYCGKLIPPEAKTCPLCGKINPLGPMRCPKCRNPVEKNWQKCANCGLTLQTVCVQCGKTGFFGDYCEHCSGRLTVICPDPKCKTEQPPLSDTCVKCGRKLK